MINCGEYGVPLAYLYVDTFAAPADCLQDPRNRINSRVKVLKEFCLALRTECILPTFILLDTGLKLVRWKLIRSFENLRGALKG